MFCDVYSGTETTSSINFKLYSIAAQKFTGQRNNGKWDTFGSFGLEWEIGFLIIRINKQNKKYISVNIHIFSFPQMSLCQRKWLVSSVHVMFIVLCDDIAILVTFHG